MTASELMEVSAAAATDSNKRGFCYDLAGGARDEAKRQKKGPAVQCDPCDAVEDGRPATSSAQPLGSVRVWIMDTHPRHCTISPGSFCYARCDPIKALLTKGASIYAVRAPHGERGIAIYINGVPAAAFDSEQETAFVSALDTGQVVLDKGIARSWAEIDFDVLAGPANQAAAVPREVQACDGFERGVLARDRFCDGNDCPCC